MSNEILQPLEARVWGLRKWLWSNSPRPSVRLCGKFPYSAVNIGWSSSTGYLSYSGTHRCGNLWLCPVCATRRSAARSAELRAVVSNWKSQGGDILFGTFTIPHEAGQSLASLWEGLLKVWRGVTRSRPYVRWSEQSGTYLPTRGGKWRTWVPVVKAVEVTWGAHTGWHPHLHVLLFVSRLDPLGDPTYLRAAWVDYARRYGYRASMSAQKVVPATDARVSSYLVKSGIAAEFTGSANKLGKAGRYTYWQMLESASRGNAWPVPLIEEYSEVAPGRHQVRIPDVLREYTGVGDYPDEELVEPYMLDYVHPTQWATVLNQLGPELLSEFRAYPTYSQATEAWHRIAHRLQSIDEQPAWWRHSRSMDGLGMPSPAPGKACQPESPTPLSLIRLHSPSGLPDAPRPSSVLPPLLPPLRRAASGYLLPPGY